MHVQQDTLTRVRDMESEGGQEVRLLGKWMGPFAWRARIALNLRKIGYDLLEEKLESKSELLLMSNPIHKKIPVLLHHGRPICESLIILDYIDEAWPPSNGPSILPSNPHDRAITRFWASYIDEKWFPNLVGFLGAQREEEKAVAVEGMLEGLQVLEDVFEKCNMGKKASYFNGDTIGFLDIALGCFLGWIRAVEKISGKRILDDGKTPLLFGWATRFGSHDAVKEGMPEIDMLIEHAKFLHTKWSSEALQANKPHISHDYPLRTLWM